MDIMVPGVNKGKALAQVQQLLFVRPDETLAFGDYYNDVELLQQAGYGYVMKNAADGMKKHAKLIKMCIRDRRHISLSLRGLSAQLKCC